MSTLFLGIESSCDENGCCSPRSYRRKAPLAFECRSEPSRASRSLWRCRSRDRQPCPPPKRHPRHPRSPGTCEHHGPRLGLPSPSPKVPVSSVPLLVGLQLAKALAYVWKCPLIGVNHLDGHLKAVFLEEHFPQQTPYIALLVSGGHTSLYRVESHIQNQLLGATRDDAAGEAFDKRRQDARPPLPRRRANRPPGPTRQPHPIRLSTCHAPTKASTSASAASKPLAATKSETSAKSPKTKFWPTFAPLTKKPSSTCSGAKPPKPWTKNNAINSS